MKNSGLNIYDEAKLKILAESIYEEAKALGFSSTDYVKLINSILNLSMINNHGSDLNVTNELPVIESTDLPVESKNLIIRKYNKQSDMATLKTWLQDEKSKLFLLSRTSANDLNVEDLNNNENQLFGMVTLKNGIPIGLLALLNIDRKNKKAEMRKLIGSSEYRGRGFAKEATKMWLSFCMNTFNLNKIYINTLEVNILNITLNRNLGFKIEGVLRKECFINGKEYDVFRMAYYKENQNT